MCYEKNVFINCPYDENYNELLRKLVFTVTYLGYNIKIASNNQDTSEIRLNKILELIKSSKFSIHDISRNQAKKKGEMFRLNMAFELGIDYGCKNLIDRHQVKKFLIFDREQYLCQKSISDLNGMDIKNHKNDPFELMTIVRNWFVSEDGLIDVPSPQKIWNRFTPEFVDFFVQSKFVMEYTEFDINIIPINEYIKSIKDWMSSLNV